MAATDELRARGVDLAPLVEHALGLRPVHALRDGLFDALGGGAQQHNQIDRIVVATPSAARQNDAEGSVAWGATNSWHATAIFRGVNF